ncbi:MAG: outer membrane protein assembly factor BamB [Xylophilus ampelinus]
MRHRIDRSRAAYANPFTIGRILARGALAACMVAALGGCSTVSSWFDFGSKKPQPAELGPNPGLVAVRPAWSAKIGPSEGLALTLQSQGGRVMLASANGGVYVLDAVSGREIWRASAGSPLSAAVGSDGETVAVVTRGNELVAFADGKELWRKKLPAGVYTAPLVTGERVFVLAADRSVSAFDGRSGVRLWMQQRPGEPLVLQQPGVLVPVGDTLVVGLSGRMAGLNPLNGSIRWEAPIASPRGTNDVERLVDLVGRVAREGTVVCARAFQASVGCVDAARGTLLWSKAANGFQGLDGDGSSLYGTEAEGTVVAWKRDSGDRAWAQEKLRYRVLSAPLVVGRSVVFGDGTGTVHMLSREDGAMLNRMPTDGSAITAAPILAGNTLVVATSNGGVFGFVPQ